VRARWGDFESFPRRAIVALLRPMPFTNGSGDTAPLHAGDVQLRLLK
jgi:hypothetical protein